MAVVLPDGKRDEPGGNPVSSERVALAVFVCNSVIGTNECPGLCRLQTHRSQVLTGTEQLPAANCVWVHRASVQEGEGEDERIRVGGHVFLLVWRVPVRLYRTGNSSLSP